MNGCYYPPGIMRRLSDSGLFYDRLTESQMMCGHGRDRDLLAIKCTGSSNSPVMRGRGEEREKMSEREREERKKRERERRSLFFDDWARENSSLVYSSGHSREKKPV